MANGKLGQTLETRNLGQNRKSRGSRRSFGEFEFLQTLERVQRQASNPRRGNLHLQALQRRQVPEFRRKKVNLVSEELQRSQPREPRHRLRNQAVNVLVHVKALRGVPGVLRRRKFDAFSGHVESGAIVGSGVEGIGVSVRVVGFLRRVATLGRGFVGVKKLHWLRWGSRIGEWRMEKGKEKP